MELTVTYVFSQIFIVISYIFLAISYQSKNREKILILSFASLVATGLSYLLLEGYTAVSMVVVASIRNLIFMHDEKKYGKNEKITKRDIIILIILYTIVIIFTIFTYDGFLSLLSVIATMLYTFSVWQKKTLVYKILGIPIGLLWIGYNIYVKSLFGIILEIMLLLFDITGLTTELKSTKKIEKK